MTSRIFVVVWHDRHVNDSISLYRSREGADSEIERMKEAYNEYGYTWTEHSYGCEVGWVRFVESNGGDGPHGRIETHDLEDK